MWELPPSWEAYELHSSADLQQCFQYWKSPATSRSGYLCCLKSLATGCPGREGNSSVVRGRHPSSAEQQDFACVSFVCLFLLNYSCGSPLILATANSFPEHPCRVGKYARNFMQEAKLPKHLWIWAFGSGNSIKTIMCHKPIWNIDFSGKTKSMIHSLCMLMTECQCSLMFNIRKNFSLKHTH